MGKGTLLVSATIVFFCYFMYVPLPAGVTHPWKLRFTTLAIDSAVSISYLGEKIAGIPFSETMYQLSVMLNSPVHSNFPQLQVYNHVFDGVPVRIYRPKGLKDLSPCIVYYHGGGWVMLNIDTYDAMLTKMALETGMIVVAVRYRYAPQHPYPIPFDDCVKATAHLLRSGDEIGVDVNRVAVAGDSAGGNLAAAVSLRLSQEDPTAMPPIKLQVLICPTLQALDFNTTSMRENSNWYIKKGLMIFVWAAYLGLDLNSETYFTMARGEHVSSSQRAIYGAYIRSIQGAVDSNKYNVDMAKKLDHLVVEPFVAPLMADNRDLAKVAPAYVIAMEFDVLRDEAKLYAERLKSAGVKTDLWLVKGQPHITIFSAAVPFFDQSDMHELYGNVSEYVKRSL